jgi:hypothetical protein
MVLEVGASPNTGKMLARFYSAVLRNVAMASSELRAELFKPMAARFGEQQAGFGPGLSWPRAGSKL